MTSNYDIKNGVIEIKMDDGTIFSISLIDDEITCNDDGSGSLQVNVDAVTCPSGAKYVGDEISDTIISEYNKELSDKFAELLKQALEFTIGEMGASEGDL